MTLQTMSDLCSDKHQYVLNTNLYIEQNKVN